MRAKLFRKEELPSIPMAEPSMRYIAPAGRKHESFGSSAYSMEDATRGLCILCCLEAVSTGIT